MHLGVNRDFWKLFLKLTINVEQEKESTICVIVGCKNLSLRSSLVMPNGDPQDGYALPSSHS